MIASPFLAFGIDFEAYELPIIEQGAILLSEPNDHFCVNQQYFHKNVIFLVDHQPGGLSINHRQP